MIKQLVKTYSFWGFIAGIIYLLTELVLEQQPYTVFDYIGFVVISITTIITGCFLISEIIKYK